jgi:hypothetical protein
MLGLVGILAITVGAATAHVAGRYPGYVERLETGAGLLLIGGFALLGFGAPMTF